MAESATTIKPKQKFLFIKIIGTVFLLASILTLWLVSEIAWAVLPSLLLLFVIFLTGAYYAASGASTTPGYKIWRFLLVIISTFFIFYSGVVVFIGLGLGLWVMPLIIFLIWLTIIFGLIELYLPAKFFKK